MNFLRLLLRAEYLWQPAQLARRAWRIAQRTNSRPRAQIALPWKFPITVDPRESIGRSIVALNTLDLPVTESIWRLLDPGETCADLGANIGYMTSVMAARLKRGGKIFSFEPVPELADALREHARAWSSLTRATIDVRQAALSQHGGPATIYIPASFAENRGESSLAPREGATGHRSITVETFRFDEIIDDATKLGLVKIDVEGFEFEVLQGAERLLRTGQIRDILLEEHRPFEAPSLAYLRKLGYEIFRVTRGWTGPGLNAPDCRATGELDPPTYLATTNAARARARFAARGWASLRGAKGA